MSRPCFFLPRLIFTGSAAVSTTAIGSVIGFTTYLMLVSRIGSSRAAYATVLFPIVALSLSTVFEGYHWSGLGLIGLALTLVGNVIIFARPPARRALQVDARVPAGE